MPSPMTEYINTMIESRAFKRYEPACFDREFVSE